MNTPLFSLNQAAKEAGKSTSTISKYLKNGRLSYVSKDEGGYKIDPAELFRVFPKTNSEHIREKKDRKIANTSENTIEYIQLQAERDILDEKLKMREEQNSDLKNRIEAIERERDDWRDQAKQGLRLLEDQSKKNPPEKIEKGDETILRAGGGESRLKAISGEILAALGIILCLLMFAMVLTLYL